LLASLSLFIIIISHSIFIWRHRVSIAQLWRAW